MIHLPFRLSLPITFEGEFMNLKPARTQAQGEISFIADLDKFRDKSVGFVLNGQTHILQPITGYDLVNIEIARITLLQMMTDETNGKTASTDTEKYEKYYEMIHPLAPQITFAEVTTLNATQLNQILSLIQRQIQGDPTLYDGLKKKLQPPKTRLQRFMEFISDEL